MTAVSPRRRVHHYVPGVFSALPPFPGKIRVADMLGRLRGTLWGARASSRLGWRTRIEVDLHDRIQRQMWAGCYEPHVRKCVEALLVEGDVFVDVGAHIGYVSAIAAQSVGPTGKVFSFEPDPLLHEMLTRNVAGQPWVQTLRSAVWKDTGTLTFERASSEGESGWGTLTAIRDLKRGEHVKVQATSLDDWVARSAVGSIQAMKIDAEGSEVSILDGASKTIRRLRPAIIMELNDTILRQAGASAAALLNHPTLTDYTLYGLSWLRLKTMTGQEAGEELFPEILCLPNDRIDQSLPMLRQAGFKLC